MTAYLVVHESADLSAILTERALAICEQLRDAVDSARRRHRITGEHFKVVTASGTENGYGIWFTEYRTRDGV